MKKILGFIICIMLITTTGFSVIGINEKNQNELNAISNQEISTTSILEEQENAVWINVTPTIKYVGGTLLKRQMHNMAFDSNAGCVILFGGRDAINYLFETWAYNYANNTWFNRWVTACPNGFSTGNGMVYDSKADKTILFGGGVPVLLYNYTWAYDFTTNTWENRTARSDYGEVNGVLMPNYDCAMAYDCIADRTILYGGNNILPYWCNETWVYNYSDNKWYNMTPTVTVIGGMPIGGIQDHTMVFDIAHNCTVMFGGYANFGGTTAVINYTYVYYFENNTWVNMTPSMTVVGGELYPRSKHSMCYDDYAGMPILMGGDSGPPSIQYKDTWVYNVTENTWYNVSYSMVGGTFWERAYTDMVYDSVNNKTITALGYNSMGGGGLESLLPNDTWVFKHNSGNEPPNTPTDPDPANGSLYVDCNADLSWYCWDLDFDALTYDVYFEAEDSTPDVKVSSNQTQKNYDPGTMDYNTTYYWQIVAWDELDQVTVGPIWHFTTRGPNNAPYIPSNPDPSDEETNVSLEANLSWTGGDPDPWDIVTYDVYLEADDPTPDVKVSSNQTETTFDPGIMSVSTQYYWQIIAWDTEDASTEGPVWSFNTIINDPPDTPFNPEPEDGATDVDINADLSWECSDPEDDDLTYDVYFEANDPTPDVLVSNNQSGNTYDPGEMEYDTHYYWKIVTWDPYQYTEGPVWDFTTGVNPNNPPYVPSDPDPENGSNDVDVDANLSWVGGDPDDDSVVYDVYLEANDPSPDDKVADDISETTFDPGTMEYETVYYWRIIAKDSHGASTWGPVWHFTTTKPDLDCEGSLSWTNVKPGKTVKGNFTVRNIGGPSTLLDWEIAEDPEWGTWNFLPSSGDDLKPGDGPITVIVSAKAPDEKNSEFDGEIKIVNKANSSDYCIIDASLTTPKNKMFNFYANVLKWLFERFPNAFLILRYVLGF